MNLSYNSFCYGRGGLPSKILWGTSIIRIDSYPIVLTDAFLLCLHMAKKVSSLQTLIMCSQTCMCTYMMWPAYVCVYIHTVFNSVIIQNLNSSWALISIIFSFLVCLKKDWIAKFPETQSRLHHSSFILIVMLIHRWGTFALIVVNNLYIPSKTAEG